MMTAISQIVLLTLSGSVAEFRVLQEQGPARLILWHHPTADIEIPLSGSLPLEIHLRGGFRMQVEPFKQTTLDEGWELYPEGTSHRGGVFSGWHEQQLVLEPLKPGRLSLTVPPLRYRDRDGPWQTVVWKPIVVNVTTTARPDVNDLRDITSPENLPNVQPDSGRNVWFWLPVVGTTAIVLIVTAAWRRRKREVATLSPGQLAQRELDRVVSLGLPGAGKTVEFHFLVHDIVRRYLKRRYRIPGRCSTTEELLRSLRDLDVPIDRLSLHEKFFQHCEPARFSGRIPSAEECSKTLEMARQIID